MTVRAEVGRVMAPAEVEVEVAVELTEVVLVKSPPIVVMGSLWLSVHGGLVSS